MSKLKWTDTGYATHRAQIGRLVKLTVFWSDTGYNYGASINEIRLTKRFNNLDDAKAAAEATAKQLINEAVEEME